MNIASPEPDARQASGFTFGEDASGVYHLLFSSKINVLLLSLPAGWACHFIKVPDVATFTLVSPQVFWSMSDSSRRSHCEHLRHIVRPLMQQSCFEMTCKVQNLVALIPLAWLLGWTTEDLSKRCGPVAGGLINATFGNAPELILSIIALLHGLPTVALASLLGSVLSNLLLVLGSCFFIGNLMQGTGRCLLYDISYITHLSSGMLMAASMLAGVASSSSVYGTAFTVGGRTVLYRATAIILVLMYIGLLISVLWTHKPNTTDEEDMQLPKLSVLEALVVLGIITTLVTISSEFLVDALKGFIPHAVVSREFLGLIVLPLASNATDHTSAVILAARNKMNLAFGCCLGSAVQVVMILLPVLILLGWAVGKEVDLGVDVSFIIFTFLGTLLVCHVTRLGRSDWLQGFYLAFFYILIALYYALLPSKPGL